MPLENQNKKIIEDFIVAAVALLEWEGESVLSLLTDLSINEEWEVTNSDGVKFTYKKIEDDSGHFCILAKSDLMQEYHMLPDND